MSKHIFPLIHFRLFNGFGISQPPKLLSRAHKMPVMYNLSHKSKYYLPINHTSEAGFESKIN
jgi:hypothetical protein